MKCTNCKKQEACHEESETYALCDDCMDKLDVAWNPDYYEFVPRYADCPDCGGVMTWCTCCDMYSQHCCVDYGTCGCS